MPYGFGHNADDDEFADVPGHAAYYLKRRNEPLFSGASHTVLEMCYIKMHKKVHFGPESILA